MNISLLKEILSRQVKTLSLSMAGACVIWPLSAFPQSMCPIKTVKVNSLNGKVVENSIGQNPWANVVVELRLDNETQTLSSTTVTGEDGSFIFPQVKKGKYLLDIRTNALSSYRLVVRTRGVNDTAKAASFLVKLDPDCGKNEVKLLNR